MSLLRKFVTKEWYINIIFALCVIAFNFVTLSVFLKFTLPSNKNVNSAFITQSWKYYLLIAIVGYLAFLVANKTKRKAKALFRNTDQKANYKDIIYILLPITPIVQYIINQQDTLSLLESLYVFAYFGLIAFFYIYIIPALSKRIGNYQISMIVGVAFTFTVNSMAILSNQFHWFETGNLIVQLIFLNSVFLVLWFFSLRNQTETLRIIILIFFISNTITQLLSVEQRKLENIESTDAPLNFPEDQMYSIIGNDSPELPRNVYLLIYDSYVSVETMQSYGIDNTSQESFLQSQGFKLYPTTYSLESYSLGSMNRVLEMSRKPGNDRDGVSGNGAVQNIFNSIGYDTYGIFAFDFFFQGTGSNYDYSYPGRIFSSKGLIDGILMGEFRFDIGINQFSYNQFIEAKNNLFDKPSTTPFFVYSHSDRPGHTQNSGRCSANEKEKWIEELRIANGEMMHDLELIIENDPEGIVIVAGDHGPHLTKGCSNLKDYDLSEISRQDLQDRFGAFLAIRWPSGDFEEYDDITVLQDIFPAVFAYLFNEEEILDIAISPTTLSAKRFAGAYIQNGIIVGGVNNGEPLYISGD